MARRILVLLAGAAIGAGLLAGGRYLDTRAMEAEEARAAERDPLPRAGVAAEGIRVAGEPIPDPEAFEAFVRQRADALLERKVTLSHRGHELGTITLKDAGARADVDFTLERIKAFAHLGTIPERRAQARRARAGEVDVPLPVDLPAEALAAALEPFREELDVAPRSAKRIIDREAHRDAVTPHEDGSYLDVYAAAESVLRAGLRGDGRVELAAYRDVPVATTENVTRADVSTVISAFETKYGGAPGRNKNILRGASQLDGLVLMPHESVSYNEVVGPRSVENGFFSAPEIYKGEIREGIGGGACQVAGTFYAAAFFGGFEILERHNHSRPSAYIRPGMDATVSYPVLDLKIKNPYDFPVVVSAKADGSILKFEMLGKERRVEVALATETLGVLKYSRKIEKTAYLPAGEFRVKQKGRRGLSIKKIKTTKDLKSGDSKLEETTDLYPPTQEIYLVGPGMKAEDLPPLEPPAAGEGA